MTGDEQKAQAAFQDTIREAASHFAEGEPPNDRLWFFREARWRCLETSKLDLQPEPLKMDEHDIGAHATTQIKQLEPTQLAVWISAAPEPQRTALALFYLNEFDYLEILDIAELKLSTLSRCLTQGRRQLQAWLDAKHTGAPTV